jgi:hypothetical protein
MAAPAKSRPVAQAMVKVLSVRFITFAPLDEVSEISPHDAAHDA